MIMFTGNNLVGYTFSGSGGFIFKRDMGVNGKSNEVSFYEATPEEINRAVTIAAGSFTQYRKLPVEKRINFLMRIALAIEDSKDELVSIAAIETKLPEARLKGEIQRTVNQVKLFVELLKEGSWVRPVIDTAQPERTPLPKPDLRQMQIPIGPVAVFGASNFPFAFSVAGGDTISALAAGCTVIYKAHPGHPGTSEKVGILLSQAAKSVGLPEGVFSLLQGETHQTGQTLVAHPLLKAVAFTGSFNGGKALFNEAAKRPEPIPVYAEMGSINPVFILPEMMAQKAADLADKLAPSNLLGVGQFCTNPGVLIQLQTEELNSYFSKFSSHIKNASGECMLTENIYNGYTNSIEKLSSFEGVKLVASGGESIEKNAAIANMFTTTAAVFLNNRELMEEVFGPSSLHVIAQHKNELLAVAQSLTGQLTVSIWATEKDLEEFEELIKILEGKAGRIIFNAAPTGVEVTHAMVHGGPYPATTDSKTTSVGTNAIYRFTRPVCYQGAPQKLLPGELVNENPLGVWRLVNGEQTKAPINS